jgi:TPR repeat protein
MQLKSLSAAVILLLGGLGLSQANGPKPGDIDLLMDRANAGELAAQRELGEALLAGKNVPADEVVGVAWLQQAAEKGDARAHFSLFKHYQKNAGNEGAQAAARNHLRRAGALGHPVAQAHLAEILLSRAEKLADRSAEQARAREAGVALMQRAARGKSALSIYALHKLADMHLRGSHVPRSIELAVGHLERASDNGDGDASYRLARIYLDDANGPLHSVKVGLFHLHKAGNRHVPDASAELADRYLHGDLVPRDLDAAEEWAEFAIKSGRSSAMTTLTQIRAERASSRVRANEGPQAAAIDAAPAAITIPAAAAVSVAAALEAEPAPATIDTTPAEQPAVVVATQTTAAWGGAAPISHTAHVAADPVYAAAFSAARAAQPAPAFTQDAPQSAAPAPRQETDTNATSIAFTAASLPTAEELSTRLAAVESRMDTLSTLNQDLVERLRQSEAQVEQMRQERDSAIAQLQNYRTASSASTAAVAPAAPVSAAPEAVPTAEQSKQAAAIAQRGMAELNAGNTAAAIELLKQAAALGSASAHNNLAMMYVEGRGVIRNVFAAITHFEKAAAMGNATAAANIGYIYQHGKSVVADHAKAIAWYSKAQALGSPTAAAQLQILNRVNADPLAQRG